MKNKEEKQNFSARRTFELSAPIRGGALATSPPPHTAVLSSSLSPSFLFSFSSVRFVARVFFESCTKALFTAYRRRVSLSFGA